MSNVTFMPASTNFTPEQALSSAKNCKLKEVLIIGYDEDDQLVIRSSKMDRADALWMIKEAENYTFYGK